ncbi:hypothetical protein [Ferrigenium sp. UT5]|uniref:hypothetical protein n=1 Tax=Ferrigenium sp. UT5 TaxID=3242105 RepID=UPI00354D78F9
MNAACRSRIEINGRLVSVEWSPAAARELARRTRPLVVELELYFSCLVKKFVHFHETAPQRDTIAVGDKLAFFFRSVTSSACSFEVADRLGRQPEIGLNTLNVRKVAPRRVKLDFVRGVWQGNYWI